MPADQIDILIRASGACLLLVSAALLIRDARQARLVRYFVPLALCLSGFLAGNTPDPALRLGGAAGALAHVLSGYGAVFLWWFCLACFDRTFRPGAPVLGAGLAWLGIASADRELLGPLLAEIGLSRLLVAIGLFMVAHLAWQLIRDREGDLIEARRGARMIVAILLAGLLLVDLAVDIAFGFDWRPQAFAIGQNAAILLLAGWLVSLLLRADPAPLQFRAPAAGLAARPAADREEQALAERLRRLIEEERVHLDPELTVAAFAARMGASERAVRRFVNHRLGHDHFRVFLNAQRMDEARRRLADPARAGEKMIAIAFGCGFASLASFNRIFRAAQGCTPSAYRAAALGHGQDAPARTPVMPTLEERFAGF